MHDDFQKKMENSACFAAARGASNRGRMAYLDNIAVFVRVVELGNLSSAGRDLRVSPAVASNRIKELEKHLGVRLFNRTTRQLMPTEQGTAFYDGAKRVLEAIDRGGGRRQRAVRPAARHDPRHRAARARPPADRLGHSRFPRPLPRHRGAAAPVGPQCRHHEGGHRRRLPARACWRIPACACAASWIASACWWRRPGYLEKRGEPTDAATIWSASSHDCLMLRFPGAREHVWSLRHADGRRANSRCAAPSIPTMATC